MITTIGIIGLMGRMGQSIACVVDEHPNASLSCGLVRKHSLVESRSDLKNNTAIHPQVITDDPSSFYPECDVVIDFSHATSTTNYAKLAATYNKPFMSGTTGLQPEDHAALKELSSTIPILWASNTSLSLVVTKKIVHMTSNLLAPYGYDVSILDKHHKWKKDAPSGTAITLGEAVKSGCEDRCEPTYASMRAGTIIGEHDVLFAGAGEFINIQHKVTDRRVFAHGAVEAALWLAGQKPGLYTMDDVLGIS
ncbi:MAG: 4-hydroxy-tetrahydrodipicolinate reductase [Proteobacteria bacterium]|jgi:4-hydroxy-tetrahydrodipicolinate reductase|nr:4-hydroxy-tetrahydrodipicolinate reductase [Alphaproteobacteria bacterium]NCC03306.1 4-hydroxy-tetrahydrodipicolinate reductase [Pseudomonadota bacterium]